MEHEYQNSEKDDSEPSSVYILIAAVSLTVLEVSDTFWLNYHALDLVPPPEMSPKPDVYTPGSFENNTHPLVGRF